MTPKQRRVISGNDPLCGRIATALGLENVASVVLSLKADSIVTVDATFYPSEDVLLEIADAMEERRYVLMELCQPEAAILDTEPVSSSNAPQN